MALHPGKRLVLTLLLGVLAVFALIAFFVVSLTFQPDDACQEKGNSLDTYEARRKMKIITDSLKSTRKGFVSLSEKEINAFLEATYSAPPPKTNGPPEKSGMLLRKCSVDLTPTNIVFYCWASDDFFGRRFPLAWQRTASVKYEVDHWSFEVQKMKVGKITIPSAFWPTISGFFHAVDQTFANLAPSLTKIPAVELAADKEKGGTQFILYNYIPETLKNQ